MKKRLFLVFLSVTLLVSGCSVPSDTIGYYLPDNSPEATYNASPSTEGKIEEVRSPMASYEFDFSDLWIPVYYSEAAVIVTAESDPVMFSVSADGTVQSDKATANANSCFTNVKVEEIIFGDSSLKGKTVKFNQFMIAEKELCKLKKGETYLLLITSYLDDYKWTSSERSMFHIADDYSVTTYTTNPDIAKYDGLHSGYLINDIKANKAISKKEKLEQMKYK